MGLALVKKAARQTPGEDYLELARVDGVGPVAAGHLVDFFSEKHNVAALNGLLKHVTPKPEPKAATSSKVTGLTIVFTGTLEKMTRDEAGTWGYHWGFTSLSATRLFGDAFSPATVRVTTYGNVLTAAAFLYGLAREELTPDELNFTDPEFELLVCIRAQKPA